ncbi:MAG TPA: glycosyltransferase, partial [Puia sp.]|nr:glycosyltransferase [Puia sp.]
MKIVHIVEPFASGIATFIRSLVEGLREDTHIIIHGERSQVMGCEEIMLDFPMDNVHFIRWHSAQREIRPIKDLRAFLELLRILRRLKKYSEIDVVHLHSSKSGFLGRLACRAAGIRRVIYTPNGAPFLAGSSAARFLFKLLEKIGDAFGGLVVCCSPSERREYKSIGIDAMCINNGVQVRRYKKRAVDRTARFRIVTCGRIIGQKNPGLFNQVAAYFE